MKIPLRQLDGALKGRLPAAWFVSGAEPLLVDEALEKIRAAARAAGFDTRELHVVDRSFRWAELEASADNLSLFAARRLVELRLHTPRLGDEGGATVRGLVERPDPDRLLLIGLAERLDASAARTAWVKAIEEHGVWVEVWPVGREELPRWIGERARTYGVRLTADAADALAERVEGNLLAADQELKKLSLAGLGGRELDEAAVLEAVAISARYDVFGLADAVTAGDARRAFQVLDGLRLEGVEPVLLSWALCREIGLLARLQYAAEHGGAVDSLLARERVPRRRHPALKGALRRFGWAELKRLLARAADLDAAVKGGSETPPWEALTGFVLESMRAGRAPRRARV